MAENERPLSDFISSVEQVDLPEEDSIKEPLEEEKPKKSKLFPIIVGILLLLIIGIGSYYIYKQYFAEEEAVDVNTIPAEEEEESSGSDYGEDASLVDVGKYTDIKLKDYDGLYLGTIEETIDETAIGFREGVVAGVVSYYVENYNNPPRLENLMKMKISNKKNAITPIQQSTFNQVVTDIKNKNSNADWRNQDEATPFWTPGQGSTMQTYITAINNFEYEGTEDTFGMLLLSGGHEGPSAGEESNVMNFIINLYAIKGDNIILLTTSGNLYLDLISEVDHEECKELYEGSDDYYTYDVECLAQKIDSGDYDSKLSTIINTLTSRFVLQD